MFSTAGKINMVTANQVCAGRIRHQGSGLAAVEKGWGWAFRISGAPHSKKSGEFTKLSP